MLILDKAISIAVSAHSDQYRKYRKNGYKLPYISHPLEVMKVLWQLGMGDEITLCCGVLHDVIEDNLDNIEYYSNKIIELNNNDDIYNVVYDLTIFEGQSKEDYLKKFASNTINPRSLVVKACDRICNVLDFFEQDKDYSRKYLRKAKCIEIGLEVNYLQIKNIWGKEAVNNLLDKWNSLWKK